MNKDPGLKLTRDLKDNSELEQMLTHDLNVLLYMAEYGLKGLSSVKKLTRLLRGCRRKSHDHGLLYTWYDV